MCSLRQGRCVEQRNMGTSRKQITFDLNQESLRQWYPHQEPATDPQYYKRAYKDIQRFMSENGFERRQRSVYVSTGELTTLDIVSLMQQMAGRLPWLGRCAECVDTTDIGTQHSLLGLLRSELRAPEVIPPVPAHSWTRQKKKARPER